MEQNPQKTIIHIDGQANTINMFNSTPKESVLWKLVQNLVARMFNLK